MFFWRGRLSSGPSLEVHRAPRALRSPPRRGGPALPGRPAAGYTPRVGPWRAAIYDPVAASMERGSVGDWRAELLGAVAGDVVEIGAGTGANLRHYRHLRSLTLAEPDRWMRRRLLTRAAGARVIDSPAERLDLPDASADVVVSTLVLCSVQDVPGALAEARRVLRPGGRLVFLEHVRALSTARALADHPVTALARRRAGWQDRLDPFWVWAAGGCHFARDTARVLEEHGWAFERLAFASARGAAPLVRPMIRGVARPA